MTNPPRTAAVLCLLATAAAQDPAPGSVRELPRPQEFVQTQDDNLFSLPRSQEDIHSWEQALEELAEGKHAAAVERLHRLVQDEIGGVAPVAPGQFLGLRLGAIQTLANLPPAATEAYENLVKREAGALLRRPLTELGVEHLALLADRYPASEPGREARLRLGDLLLEAGQGQAAVSHFRAALDAARFGSAGARAAAERLRLAGAVHRPMDHRGKGQPAAVGDVLQVLPAADDDPAWPALGGGGGGATPMTDPIGSPSSQWTVELYAPGFEIDNGPFAMHAIGDLGGIYVSNGVRLQAFDPLRKALLWASPAPLEQLGDVVRIQAEYDRAINQDMTLAPAFGGDVVVAGLQVPEDSDNVRFRGTFQIISKIPERRLHAFHRQTGKLLWAHFDRLDGALARRFRGHSVCGPPLVQGDTVYVPTHDRAGAIAFYLSAYDLHTGAPRWRRLICSSQQEVNMFGNARAEFAASPIAAHDGVIYGSSNLGVCYAVELATGRLRWIHAYDVTELPLTQFHGQPDRPVYFANNAPVVADQAVALTPLDSMYALGLDTETGRRLWRLPYPAKVNGTNDVRWLVGTFGEPGRAEFVFAGAGVVAVKAWPDAGADGYPQVRQIQRREYLNDRDPGRGHLPRPALSAEFVYFPAHARLSIFDQAGTLAPHAGNLRLRQPGNLLLVDGMMVCLRNGMLDFLYDPDALLLRAEARLRTDQEDPAAILRLATLRRALQGDRPPPEDLYRRGLEIADRRSLPADHPVRLQLRAELFDAMFARARRSGDAGLLRQCREVAPDAAAWLQAQLALLAALDRDPAAATRELRLMAERHGAVRHAMPGTGVVPVAAWVLWRMALLQQDPAAAVQAWQDLLEQFPDERFGDRRAADLAHAAISGWLDQAGRTAYRTVELRARGLLEMAGTDPDRLRAIADRFPHSEAAADARRRLLDAAVERGDLGAATDMLAQALREGDPSPGLLRRAMAAARGAGNRGLARGLAERLEAQAGGEASDYGPDGGATYRAVLAPLWPELRAAPAPLLPAPPETVLRTFAPRSPVQRYKLPQLLQARGFPPPPDTVVYGIHPEVLVAFDPAGSSPDPLFQVKVSFLESLIQCGRVLIVPDLSSIAAYDHRSGELLWELPNPTQKLYECLGVTRGVLHVTAQTAAADAAIELLGIEPLTGRLLFRRELPPERFPSLPRSGDGRLLLLEAGADVAPAMHRLDPLTGRSLAAVPLGGVTQFGLRPEVLAMSRLFPQTITADDARVYVPIDGPQANGTPTVAALDGQGALAWQWTGVRGRRLLQSVRRGDRLAVVEAGARSGDHAGGRALVLATDDGRVLREIDLGDSVHVLNWDRTWLPKEPPALLTIIDRAPDRSAIRRLTGIALDDGLPSFQQTLAPDDGEGVTSAVLGLDFATFAVRPAQRGPLQVYSLRLQDRRGALADGRKQLRLPLQPHYEMGPAGPYTVISSGEGLSVLGAERSKR